ncbi:hypothetical protein Mal64_04400 [Pseudobythopirellula maris]|uniref:Uncharacterized protein n=1 Tax=Pseudobythopirellula maris TaxID=2527991 RepID=A0A5C5ZST9_9BACT|nr:hypothetical protein [Pseudobythopirellula maris]TWT90057.1 hypothetical protein Mal64_04400 [Pseudobythopirellula maris]
MRALLIVALLAVVLALIGWVTFYVGPDRTGVDVDTQRIEQDISGLKDSAEQLGDRFTENNEVEPDVEAGVEP